MSSSLISLSGAALGYQGVSIVEHVDLDVQAGEALAIVGDNGVGKTTLLRCLAGVLAPIHGKRVTRPGLRLGYVPQQARLDPIFPYTVGEVVGQGLACGPRLPAANLDRRPEIQLALERVGMAERRNQLFRDLSGGQKQRVLLARATALPVDLLLLDEPTAGVDQSALQRIQEALRSLLADGTGIVVVTHHPSDWKEVAQKWCTISGARVQVRSVAP